MSANEGASLGDILKDAIKKRDENNIQYTKKELGISSNYLLKFYGTFKDREFETLEEARKMRDFCNDHLRINCYIILTVD